MGRLPLRTRGLSNLKGRKKTTSVNALETMDSIPNLTAVATGNAGSTAIPFRDRLGSCQILPRVFAHMPTCFLGRIASALRFWLARL